MLWIAGGLIAAFSYVVLMDWMEDMRRFKSKKIPTNIGQSNSKIWLGDWFYHNFNKHKHMAIAGHTGYGKTNMIKVILEQVKGEVVLIDLKKGLDYDITTATEITEAKQVLKSVVDDMRRDSKHTYVVIDEAYELLVPSYMSKKEGSDYLKCQHYVSEIARLGRSFNTHLIYCTQYPTRDVFPGQIKQNMEARIVFRLPTEVASRVALDEAGAEELPAGVAGRAIYKTDLKTELQTYEWDGRTSHAQIRATKAERSGHTIDIG